MENHICTGQNESEAGIPVSITPESRGSSWRESKRAGPFHPFNKQLFHRTNFAFFSDLFI